MIVEAENFKVNINPIFFVFSDKLDRSNPR